VTVDCRRSSDPIWQNQLGHSHLQRGDEAPGDYSTSRFKPEEKKKKIHNIKVEKAIGTKPQKKNLASKVQSDMKSTKVIEIKHKT
jgi:hypothetical protein